MYATINEDSIITIIKSIIETIILYLSLIVIAQIIIIEAINIRTIYATIIARLPIVSYLLCFFARQVKFHSFSTRIRSTKIWLYASIAPN